MSLKGNKNTNSSGKNHEHLKERLSLHVKRRLQETADKKPAGTSKCSPIKKLKHTKQQQQQHINTTSCNNINNSNNISNNNKNNTINNNNSNNIMYDGLSDNEPDANSTGQDIKEKLTTPDILTIVLNHRKNILLNDPDVIQFLESVTTK